MLVVIKFAYASGSGSDETVAYEVQTAPAIRVQCVPMKEHTSLEKNVPAYIHITKHKITNLLVLV